MDGGWGDAVDAAAFMGLSLSVVRRAIRNGHLTAFRIAGGRAVRLKRQHCDAYLESQQIVTPFTSHKRA
jgi:excisionase family DNA binding protein